MPVLYRVFVILISLIYNSKLLEFLKEKIIPIFYEILAILSGFEIIFKEIA